MPFLPPQVNASHAGHLCIARDQIKAIRRKVLTQDGFHGALWQRMNAPRAYDVPGHVFSVTVEFLCVLVPPFGIVPVGRPVALWYENVWTCSVGPRPVEGFQHPGLHLVFFPWRPVEPRSFCFNGVGKSIFGPDDATVAEADLSGLPLGLDQVLGWKGPHEQLCIGQSIDGFPTIC